MRSFTPKKPTHKLKVKAKDGMSNQAGVAWLNEDGSMSISLRPGIVLRWDDELDIVAFPFEEKARDE